MELATCKYLPLFKIARENDFQAHKVLQQILDERVSYRAQLFLLEKEIKLSEKPYLFRTMLHFKSCK